MEKGRRSGVGLGVVRARGYARVSTEEQTKNHSLTHQECAIKEYTRARGMWLQRVYREEGGTAWRAGGLRPITLTHGNWPYISNTYTHQGHSVYSQYCYRDQPVTEDAMTETPKAYTVVFTRPQVESTCGAPPFKTQRRLQGRALVSDSWMKNLAVTYAGFGDRCHKDGYNVLYGDYHTAWYADIEQRIIWWSPPNVRNTIGNIKPDTYRGGGLLENCDYARIDPTATEKGAYKLLVPLVWHMLDEAGGQDLGVDLLEWFTKEGW